MTEQEWQECDDWRPMMAHLASRVSDRKYRLWLCAGMREIWDLLYRLESQDAVSVCELLADGKVTEEDLSCAEYFAEAPTFGFDFDLDWVHKHYWHSEASENIRKLIEMGVYTQEDVERPGRIRDVDLADRLWNASCIPHASLCEISGDQDKASLARILEREPEWPGGWLVRELFGNPFRPFVHEPHWLTWNGETVPCIARQIYANRDYDALPVLADALEEAGCSDQAVLAHCRNEARHVRGCWVVDALLGFR